jgi:hypothetical protein
MSTTVRSTNRIRIGGLLGGIMMLIIGSGVLFFGLQLRTWTQNEIAAMLPAEGRVVDVVSRTTAAYDASFYPVVEFRTADGEVIRFESGTGGDPPEYRVGDAVRVYYDPQAPQSAMIDSWKRWAPPLALIGVGGVAALIGVIGVFNALAASLSWGWGALPGNVLRALMITVVGLGILFLGWQWYASRQSRVAAMLSTQGEVVDFVSRLTSSSNRGRTYIFYPVVEFRTAEGEIIRFEGSSGSNPPMYRVGDTVRVRYDPHIPQSAVIDSWWDVLIPLIIMIAIGGALTYMGITNLRSELKVLRR